MRNKLHYQLNLLPSLKVNISLKIEGTVLKGQINISGFWAMWSLLQLLFCCCLGKAAIDKMLFNNNKKAVQMWPVGLRCQPLAALKEQT